MGNKKNLLISFIFLIMFLLVTSCSNSYTQEIPSSETVFELTLPESVPEETSVYLELIDEVTGILLNPARYEMERKSDSEFFVRLPVLNGSLLKYRYLKRESFDQIELDVNGTPVPYRTYFVSRPAIITDRIIGWEKDDLFLNNTGEISGYVFDIKSNSPLAGVFVSINSQTTTSSPDGYYEIKNIPSGEYAITAFHPNGKYQYFQQSAVIAENAVTPASFGMTASKYVRVNFSVTVPDGTIEGAPLMLLGNIEDLGNTFGIFESGTSVIPSLAKQLEYDGDSMYSLSLDLPEGIDLRYKYSLGDGFVNAEHDHKGDLVTRQVIIPGRDIKIKDSITSFSDTGGTEKLVFSISVPDETPQSDNIYIQFNPYTWMPPIPLWKTGENTFSYVVYGPFNYLDGAQFRICRNGQCGLADDAATTGKNASGYLLDTPTDGKTKKLSYEVTDWAYFPEIIPAAINTNAVVQRDNFIKAVSFSQDFFPTWMPHVDWGFIDSALLGANSIVLSPEWKIDAEKNTITTQDPTTSPSLSQLKQLLTYAQETSLSPIVFPRIDLSGASELSYWGSAPLTYNWWHAWFDSYQRMITNYAYWAESQGISRLIIGGSTVSPALPQGRLPNGAPANTPFDFNERWAELIMTVREKYSGVIIFAIPDENTIHLDYEFLSNADMVMIEMKSPLTTPAAASDSAITAAVKQFMDESAYSFITTYLKPVIIGVNYPSIAGSASGCKSVAASCETLLIDGYSPDMVDLTGQMNIYSAIFSEIVQREWISGVISMGFNPSVTVLDGSSSVRGKPAGDLIREFFLNTVQD